MIFEVFVVIMSVLVLWYLKTGSKGSKNYPPGPLKLPFIGNLVQLGRLKPRPPSEVFEILAKPYNKSVVSLRVGILEQLLVHDYETIKEILCSDIWVDRHYDEWMAERAFNKSLGIIFISGDVWKEMRRFSIRTLRDFGFGKQKSMETFLHEEITDLMERLTKSIQKKDSNSTVCMKQFFTVSVLNILWTMIAGNRFSPDDQRLANLLSLSDKMSRANPVGTNVVHAFPFLRYFIPFTSTGKMRANFIQEMHQFFKDIITERREEGSFKEDQRDFIDVFLKEIEDNKKDSSAKNYYTDEQFIIVCFDLFVAGAETTANTLEFAMLYMILNPHVQKKVQDEIDKVVGSSRLPSTLDKETMPYTEATLLEVQRMANVLPIIIRATTEDTKIGSYDIDKGTVATLNMKSMHYNKELWGDPNVFRPERFLDDNMTVINASKILPFGHGKRMCMGEQLARATMFNFFTTLLQVYSFEKSPLHPSPNDEPMNGFTLSPYPYHVKVTAR